MTTQNEIERKKNIDYVLHAVEVIRPTPLCECNALLLTKTFYYVHQQSNSFFSRKASIVCFNSIPHNGKSAPTLLSSKQSLKTYLFSNVYSPN